MKTFCVTSWVRSCGTGVSHATDIRIARLRRGQVKTYRSFGTSPVKIPPAKVSKKKAKDSVDGGSIQHDIDDQDYWTVVREELKAEASRLGLGPTAITTADPSARLAAYEQWLAAGYHGEMSFLARSDRLQRRRDLSAILPEVRAVIASTLVYWPGRGGFPPEQNDPARARVSAYAWGPDYHDLLGRRLESLARWLHGRCGGVGKWYVDTGALMERDLGERAGIGFIGKNTLLIHRRLGSGMFLGEILTTLPLPAEPPPARASPAGCGKCTRCLKACPTGAFVGPYTLDARRCVSYLTIEHKGPVPVELRPLFGNRVYGCDECQAACPWNRFDWGDVAGSPVFGSPPPAVHSPPLAELLGLTEETFAARFAGTAVRRIGVRRMVRNAAVAAGNSARPAELGPALRAARRAWADDPLLVEHIQWALDRLGAGSGPGPAESGTAAESGPEPAGSKAVGTGPAESESGPVESGLTGSGSAAVTAAADAAPAVGVGPPPAAGANAPPAAAATIAGGGINI